MAAKPRVHALLLAFLGACIASDGAEALPVHEQDSSVGVNEERVVEELGVAEAALVVGGKESAPCGWPSTVDISGCTGTLIHPRVVTSAAHCLTGRTSAQIKFTAGKEHSGSFTVMGQCKTGSRWGGGASADWAYCVLPDDPRVKMMQYTPPLVGCEAERFLKPGNSAWIVGFGETAARRGDNGIKREVEVKINRVSNGTVDVGDKDVGACHGDSGGPLYIKLTDGTHDWGWRTAGSTSGAGSNCDCCTTTVFVDLRQHVKAIEENEGIDVTPCTDDDGKWAPGPDCKDFITDPGSGTGTYPMCSAPITRGPIATCGEPAAGAAGAPASQAGAGGAAAMGGSGALATAGAGGAAAAAGSGGASGSGPSTAGAAGAGTITAPDSTAAGTVASAPAQAGVGGSTVTGVGVMPGASGAPAMQHRAAGTVGTIVSPATAAAGTTAPAIVPTVTPQEPPSEGCQATHVGRTTGAGALSAFAALLLALSLTPRSQRRRSRH
jgi:hypothetical protein